MQKFIYKIILFVLIFVTAISIGAKLLSLVIEGKNFSASETESNLLVVKEHTHYDLAFVGISHARNFSRSRNHEKVESLLNAKILNLGVGGGICGIKDQFAYLDFVYKKNVTIDTVIHVISPPYLYADYLNTRAVTFLVEPFRFDFFFHYLMSDSDNKLERLFYYVRSKYQKSWITYEPFSLDLRADFLKDVDPQAVESGMAIAFEDGMTEQIFDDNVSFLKKSIERVRKNNGVSILLITPTLFGDWPGTERMMAVCKEIEEEYGVKTYNYSSVIHRPELFYDHHHLNTNGVIYFTKEYLGPILRPEPVAN